MTVEILMIVAVGLFAAGTVAAVVKAWGWRSMDLTRFKQDFGRTIAFADKFQPALAVISLLMIVRFLMGSERGEIYAIGAGVALLLILGLSVGILVPLQKRIIRQNESAEVTDPLRERWMNGHLGRTMVALAASALAVMAVTR
jgi:uncharacterized membrane protein